MDWEWGVLGAIYLGLIIYAVIARRRDNKTENFVMRYWRRCFPELDLYASHVRWGAFNRAQRNWRTILSLVAIGIVALVVVRVVEDLLDSMFQPHPFVKGSILGLILCGSLFFGLGFTKKSISRRLREELIEDGFTICRSCGYDLRASKDRCPECGEEFGSTGVAR